MSILPTLLRVATATLPFMRCRTAAAICVLLLGTAQAATPVTISMTTGETTRASVTTALKSHLARLRDITTHSLAPLATPVVTRWNGEISYRLPLSSEEQLFKPLPAEAHAVALSRLVKQQVGLQIDSNTRLHWDFQRFRTTDDQREISLKVGVHVGFH